VSCWRPGRLVALALLVLLGACAKPVPRTASTADQAERARTSWEKARAAAFAPRRFKALYKGELSQKKGTVMHGFLTVYWDGETLQWKVSAPLAGAKGGKLRRGQALVKRRGSPFPGELGSDDAIGALLGALDVSAAGRPVERDTDADRIALDGARAALLNDQGQVIALELPGKSLVRYEPGEGVPRKIDADGSDGHATLVLESLQPWPEGEAVP
jgi:hypothetical protein